MGDDAERVNEAEQHRCQRCGDFPRIIVETYNLNTWREIGRNDWVQECCTCPLEEVEKFYEDFRAECLGLREQILGESIE